MRLIVKVVTDRSAQRVTGCMALLRREAPRMAGERIVVATAVLQERIAGEALHLRELGLSDRVSASKLGVSDKTVAKAVTSAERIRHHSA